MQLFNHTLLRGLNYKKKMNPRKQFLAEKIKERGWWSSPSDRALA
jgi:hypothetical protein